MVNKIGFGMSSAYIFAVLVTPVLDIFNYLINQLIKSPLLLRLELFYCFSIHMFNYFTMI